VGGDEGVVLTDQDTARDEQLTLDEQAAKPPVEEKATPAELAAQAAEEDQAELVKRPKTTQQKAY
jgi:hypothetical protein